MGTMKVQPWGQGQGDFVVIDESEFDPERHTKYKEPSKGAAKTKSSDPKGSGKEPSKGAE